MNPPIQTIIFLLTNPSQINYRVNYLTELLEPFVSLVNLRYNPNWASELNRLSLKRVKAFNTKMSLQVEWAKPKNITISIFYKMA